MRAASHPASRSASLLGALAALGLSGAGCWVEPGHNDPVVVPASSAVVETGRSLVATSGDGAGVFVKYTAGGGWQLSWTCDTNVSHQSCAFDLRVTATDLDTLAIAGTGARLTRNAAPSTGFSLQTTTSTTTDVATFQARPGAPIVVMATINGAAYPQYLFFVGGGTCKPDGSGADKCEVATATALPVQLTPNAP